MLPQASTLAKNFDILFNNIFWFSLISFALVIGAMIYFAIRYHRTRRDPFKTPYITGHHLMEISVSVGLLIVVMVIFVWGWVDYKKLLKAPSDSLEIQVLAKQWFWEFQYPEGRKLTNELVVPLNQPVKLIMTSSDVIHSFFVPNFRVKQDVVPGQYTTLWFTATQLGEHSILCAEFCGTGHSKMLGMVKVVNAEEFQQWKKTTPSIPAVSKNPQEWGKELFSQKMCNTCHAITTQKLVGPGLFGIFGKEVELEGGKKVARYENYIRESLMQPQAKVVKGFPPAMPTFQGTLTDEEVNALIVYIKNLK